MYIVTGAAGFIGSALIKELNNRGNDNIICVDRFGSDHRWKNLTQYKFHDFVHADSFFETVKKTPIKSVKGVFHIGACSNTTEPNMDYLLENNVKYSQKMFEYCLENHIPFLYASSAATYGAGEVGFDDNTPFEKLTPLNPYGYSKLLFDRWVVNQPKTPPLCIGLRFTNVFGPNEYHKGEQASVIFKAFTQIKESGSLKLFKSHRPDFKDGMQMRDFVYIKDATRWILDLMSYTKATGVFNLGFGKARTWLDLATQVFKSMDKPIKIDWIDIPINIRSQYQYFTEAKMEKLLKLGFSGPQWTLESGIDDYVKNYLLKSNPYI